MQLEAVLLLLTKTVVFFSRQNICSQAPLAKAELGVAYVMKNMNIDQVGMDKHRLTLDDARCTRV